MDQTTVKNISFNKWHKLRFPNSVIFPKIPDQLSIFFLVLYSVDDNPPLSINRFALLFLWWDPHHKGLPLVYIYMMFTYGHTSWRLINDFYQPIPKHRDRSRSFWGILRHVGVLPSRGVETAPEHSCNLFSITPTIAGFCSSQFALSSSSSA